MRPRVNVIRTCDQGYRRILSEMNIIYTDHDRLYYTWEAISYFDDNRFAYVTCLIEGLGATVTSFKPYLYINYPVRLYIETI